MPRTDGAKCSRVGAPARCPTSLSDEELLEGIRRSNESHFNELYQRYFQRIYGFVHSRVHNHADTEEIVQETFTSVFRSIDSYRGQASLLSWIFGIAKNLANNCLRRAQNQRARLGAIDPEHLAPRQSIATCAPDQQLHMRRYAETIRRELGSQAEWQARIFEMRHLDDLTIGEIAKRTHRSSDAIRSSLYRTKRMMLRTAGIGTGRSAR